jgi:hypothetical protein
VTAAEATPAKAATTETASPEAAWHVTAAERIAAEAAGATAEPARRPTEPAGTASETAGITAKSARAIARRIE